MQCICRRFWYNIKNCPTNIRPVGNPYRTVTALSSLYHNAQQNFSLLTKYFFGPIPAIRSKSSGAAHPAGFPLLSGVLAWFPRQIFQVNTPLKKPYFCRNYLLFLRQYLIQIMTQSYRSSHCYPRYWSASFSKPIGMGNCKIIFMEKIFQKIDYNGKY